MIPHTHTHIPTTISKAYIKPSTICFFFVVKGLKQ